MTDISYMTQEGYDKLKKKVEYLVRVKRKELSKDIATARAHGDLRENAEYDAAREAQAMNELKIIQLSEKLHSARVIDDRDIPKDKAYLGATVLIRDLDTNEELEYMLVSEAEADILENKISIASPVGKGLLGHKEKDILQIKVPTGEMKYEIIRISR